MKLPIRCFKARQLLVLKSEFLMLFRNQLQALSDANHLTKLAIRASKPRLCFACKNEFLMLFRIQSATRFWLDSRKPREIRILDPSC